jgi:hypothetical protein
LQATHDIFKQYGRKGSLHSEFTRHSTQAPLKQDGLPGTLAQSASNMHPLLDVEEVMPPPTAPLVVTRIIC